MKVKDVMSTPVVSVSPQTPFKDIVETLASHGVSGVPVIQDGRLLGIVTEGDLLAKEAYGTRRTRGPLTLLADAFAGREAVMLTKARGDTAKDIMTEKVITTDADEDVRRAAARILELGVKRLPVVQDGEVVGIVSRSDLLRVFTRSDASMTYGLERLLQQCLFVPPDDDIGVTSKHGVITLAGSVAVQSSVAIVEAIVRAADGVVDVDNRLVVREAHVS